MKNLRLILKLMGYKEELLNLKELPKYSIHSNQRETK